MGSIGPEYGRGIEGRNGVGGMGGGWFRGEDKGVSRIGLFDVIIPGNSVGVGVCHWVEFPKVMGTTLGIHPTPDEGYGQMIADTESQTVVVVVGIVVVVVICATVEVTSTVVLVVISTTVVEVLDGAHPTGSDGARGRVWLPELAPGSGGPGSVRRRFRHPPGLGRERTVSECRTDGVPPRRRCCCCECGWQGEIPFRHSHGSFHGTTVVWEWTRGGWAEKVSVAMESGMPLGTQATLPEGYIYI
jgi:hypothetical protein